MDSSVLLFALKRAEKKMQSIKDQADGLHTIGMSPERRQESRQLLEKIFDSLKAASKQIDELLVSGPGAHEEKMLRTVHYNISCAENSLKLFGGGSNC